MNKKNLLLFCKSLFLLVCTQIIQAQQIYNNGPISTGPVSTDADTAPTGYTWSELQFPNLTYGGAVNYNSVGIAEFSIADDFTVPAGQVWNITSVDFYGYQTGYMDTVVPIDVLKVRIWNGDPSLGTSTIIFGDMTTNVLNAINSTDAFVYRTTTPTLTNRKVWNFNANISTSLPAGTYWIEYQVHATDDLNIFSSPVTILNTLTDPTWNAKQRDGVTWADWTDLGTSNQLAAPFVLNGTTTLDVNSNTFSSGVMLYPNPVSDRITIADKSDSINGTIEIFDLSGKVVRSINSAYTNDLSITVSDITAGNYILRLTTGNGTAVKKFLKL